MATTPAYANTPVSAAINIVTANTARDGTGTLGTLITAAANGTRVDDIYISATATTTAGVIRLFISDGTNNRLISEILVTAVTPSTTVSTWSTTLVNLGIVLQTGYLLKVSTNNAESFNVVATRAANF